MTPAGDVYGGGSPTGNVFYENGALGPAWEGTFFAADAGRNEVFSYQPARQGAGFALDRKIFLTSNVKQQYAGSDFVGGNDTAQGRDRDAVPAVGRRRRSGRRAVCQRLDRRARRRAPGSGRHAVGRDLPDCAEGLRVEGAGVRRRDDRRSDHGAAVAGGQRPRDRLRGLEGAWRGRRERGCGAAERSEPVHARPRDLPALSAGSRGPAARRVRPSRITDPALRIAAYRAMRRAGLDVLPVAAAARPRHGRRRPPRSGAVDARPVRPTSRSTSWSTSRAASTGRIAATWKRWEPAPPERSRRSTTGCAGARRQGRSAGLVRRRSRGSRGGCTCRRRWRT